MMAAQMSGDVVTERRGGVLVITINRPDARNAINEAVGRGIANAVDLLDADDELRVGVLTGAGGTFCSGMDLKAFLRGERPMVEARGLCGLTQAPPRRPLVAAVEGFAVAGGFELMLACDLVVAAQDARFGLPEVKRSLVALAGGALVLPRRIPMAVALEMLLTGDTIDATRAHALGLVNRLVPPGDALGAAVELAERVARNAPLAVAASKRIALDSADWTVSEGWEKQDAIGLPVIRSQDAREGARAFAEKREPVWQGR